jgi:hypothetical protein
MFARVAVITYHTGSGRLKRTCLMIIIIMSFKLIDGFSHLLQALDLLLEKLNKRNFPFQRVVSISGCGQVLKETRAMTMTTWV